MAIRLCIVLIALNKPIQTRKSHFTSISSVTHTDGASSMLIAIFGINGYKANSLKEKMASKHLAMLIKTETVGYIRLAYHN